MLCPGQRKFANKIIESFSQTCRLYVKIYTHLCNFTRIQLFNLELFVLMYVKCNV